MQRDLQHGTGHGSIDRTRQNLTAAAVVMMVVGVAGFAGCASSECDPDDIWAHCEGNTLAKCEYWHGEGPWSAFHWEREACPLACAQFGKGASCIDSLTPVAACAKDGPACWDDRRTWCVGGFPTQTEADGACPAETFCDGGVLKKCASCYVYSSSDCGGPDLCHTVGVESRCTYSSMPDPRCGDPSRQAGGFCDNDVAYKCWYGYVVEDPDDCGSKGLTCHESPPGCFRN